MRLTINKLLMFALVLSISSCAGVIPVKAKEPIKADLKVFCEGKSILIQKLLFEVVDDNHELHNMIREDMVDFVPVLFAQFRMESLSIMLYATLVEVLRTAKDGEVSGLTLTLLDQYIELIRYGMIKAKLFEGMIEAPNSFWRVSKDQLILKEAAVNLKVAHDLLVDIKKGLEELK